MKPLSYYSKSALILATRIDEYFVYIEGEPLADQPPVKENSKSVTAQKAWEREPEFATISGMALFLGFTSKQEFEAYEQNGKYAQVLKRGRLRVEAAYEARLHQTPTGVIFALKTLGWNDKPETIKPTTKTDDTLKIEIINSGPLPAGSEKEVTL
ncbi:MAG: terminase small subunit [Mucilaginibacter sp.]|uniref:terminase small subunit n=1 Tax=Mucilaginibacter sp. TaxID=1882438 RepID=UPI0031AA15DF